MESDLPWVPGAIRALLLADAEVESACGGRVSTRANSDVTLPYITVRMPPSSGDMGGGGYRPLVQIDAWSLDNQSEDPEVIVWRIASRSARALRGARNVAYESMFYTPRVLDMTALPPDVSRGEGNPLYRAAVRAELTIHNR